MLDNLGERGFAITGFGDNLQSGVGFYGLAQSLADNGVIIRYHNVNFHCSLPSFFECAVWRVNLMVIVVPAPGAECTVGTAWNRRARSRMPINPNPRRGCSWPSVAEVANAVSTKPL